MSWVVAVWIVVWILLVGGAAVFLGLLVRNVFRRGAALFTELSLAADRLQVIDEELQELQERSAPQVAVFESPAELRRQRILVRRRPKHRAGRA